MSPADLLVPGPLHALAACIVAAWIARRAGVAPGWQRALWAWALVAWVLATPVLGDHALRSLEDRHVQPPPASLVRDERSVVIVLASGQMFRGDGAVEPILDERGWARLRAGIALWRSVGGRLVLVGGPGTQPQDSMAGLMQRAAIEAGVPAEAVLAVGGSRNTREDLLLAARALGPPDGPRWLVTSALHLPRAAAVAETLGLQARPFPCDRRQLSQPSWLAWLPSNAPPSTWRDVLHEWMGLAAYRMRGWIA